MNNRSDDWQKVQYNTDLLKQRQINLYRKWKCQLIIKIQEFVRKGIWGIKSMVGFYFLSLFLICEFVLNLWVCFEFQKQFNESNKPIISKSFSPKYWKLSLFTSFEKKKIRNTLWSKSLIFKTGNPYWRGGLNTVDLLVLTCL